MTVINVLAEAETVISQDPRLHRPTVNKHSAKITREQEVESQPRELCIVPLPSLTALGRRKRWIKSRRK